MPTAAVDALVSAYPEPQRSLVQALRKLVHAVGPRLEERIKWGKPVYGHASIDVFSLVPHSGHVNVQFFHGAALVDAGKLLEGTGKSMRHVKCRTKEDVDRPALRHLMDEAVDASRRA